MLELARGGPLMVIKLARGTLVQWTPASGYKVAGVDP